MVEALPFQTRARTVDHLGREQIADCPTAISELWKNAYDAYASNVELHIYDGEVPVATIVDDGHGMNRQEFIDKWLVVGTESKAVASGSTKEDMKGLHERIKQGQKGIGRLSCANIAPLLLLVSKRENDSFVASLIDWRLFENPYLILSDIKIPVVEFEASEELIDLIPDMFDQLLANLWGEKPHDRDDKSVKVAKEAYKSRVELAWSSYDEFKAQERLADENLTEDEKKAPLPSVEIETTLIGSIFEGRHLKEWAVWERKETSGTALLMANLHFDLRVQLEDRIEDAAIHETKSRFFETLSSFVDPFWSQSKVSNFHEKPPIDYGVFKWIGDCKSLVLGTHQNFSLNDVEEMEHIVEGRINHEGAFKGRIRAFGRWYEDIHVSPPKDLSIPHAPASKLGPIDVYIASMEFNSQNTTHTKEQFRGFLDLAARYSGLMIHRDGLRVLPFGRTDADFFDIEQRRSKNAGREFWNSRQMFGRLGVSRRFNPNLTDKAGREGLLDNRAAKTFKIIIANLLMAVARTHFGSASKLRKDVLPDIVKTNKSKKADEERKKLRVKNRKQFRAKLNKYTPRVLALLRKSTDQFLSMDLTDEPAIDGYQEILDDVRSELKELSLGETPKNLSENNLRLFDEFSSDKASLQTLVKEVQNNLNIALEAISEKSPVEHARKKIDGHKKSLSRSVKKYQNEIAALQKDEFNRIAELVAERGAVFDDRIEPVIVKLEADAISLHEALEIIQQIQENIELENSDLFDPYIRALECLEESIDLEVLATFGMEQVSELSSEIDRLNSLAQLGIAIEIIGHELQSFDDLIGAGLRELPEKIKDTDPYHSIETGYLGLTNQLRFLSPLKLSGPKKEQWVTGPDLFDYVKVFFGESFAKNDIKLTASKSFGSFQVFDQPSRLYPVFINLVNNSRYWLANHRSKDRKLIFDIVDEEIVISDNGPGVDPSDIESLFTLFFTKKLKGGRGVGLYLCRANLAASGHRIRYVTSPEGYPLSGANFAISFKGAKYA